MDFILVVVLVLVLLGVCIFTISFVSAIFRGVPQVGTYGEMFALIEREIPAELPSGKKLLDLGSGTGKMARFFASKCGLRVVGYEIDFGNWLLASVYTRIAGIRGVTFRRSDFFQISDEELHVYDYIYIYLFPKAMQRIEREMLPRCKPGTTIIVNSFPFSHTPTKRVLYKKNKKEGIFIYKV